MKSKYKPFKVKAIKPSKKLREKTRRLLNRGNWYADFTRYLDPVSTDRNLSRCTWEDVLISTRKDVWSSHIVFTIDSVSSCLDEDPNNLSDQDKLAFDLIKTRKTDAVFYISGDGCFDALVNQVDFRQSDLLRLVSLFISEMLPDREIRLTYPELHYNEKQVYKDILELNDNINKECIHFLMDIRNIFQKSIQENLNF